MRSDPFLIQKLRQTKSVNDNDKMRAIGFCLLKHSSNENEQSGQYYENVE